MLLEILMATIIHGNLNNNHNHIIPGKSANELSIEADELRNQQLAEQKSRVIQASAVETAPDRAGIRNEIYQEASAKWGDQEALDMLWVVNFESGFNPQARNGQCFGLFQMLGYTSDNINQQITDGLDYVKSRYKLPSVAKQHELSFRWF